MGGGQGKAVGGDGYTTDSPPPDIPFPHPENPTTPYLMDVNVQLAVGDALWGWGVRSRHVCGRDLDGQPRGLAGPNEGLERTSRAPNTK